jgi:hypothetical protein
MAVASNPQPSAPRPPPTPFLTVEDIHDLVAAFERCEIPRAAWNHRAHLVVALWYLVHYGAAEGAERVRRGIQRLNAANGVAQTPSGGYHETITRFYLWAVGRHLRDAPHGVSLADLANTLVAVWGDKNRPLEYYSHDRLFSWEARTTWMEPDLKELDCSVFQPLLQPVDRASPSQAQPVCQRTSLNALVVEDEAALRPVGCQRHLDRARQRWVGAFPREA